jgi:integrase
MMHASSSTATKRGRKSIAERERAEKGSGSVYYERNGGCELSGRWIATEPRQGMKPLLFRASGPKEGADGEQARLKAIAKRETFRLQVARGEADPLAGFSTPASAEPTVSEYVVHWMDAAARPVYETQRGEQVRIGGFEETTYSNYLTLTTKYILPHFNFVRMKDADGEHMEAWMKEMIRLKVPPSQRANAKKLLTQIFNHALARKRQTGVTHNPLLLIKGSAGYHHQKPKASKHADVMRLMRATRNHERLGALVPMAVMLGLRRQELLALKWKHVDLANKTVTIALKGNRISGVLKERPGVKMDPRRQDTLHMPDLLHTILLEHRERLIAFKLRMGTRWKGPQNPVEGEAYVFPAPHSRTRRCGLMCSPEHVNEWYANECAKVGFPNTKLHQCRHNCASFLRRLGVPMVEIKEILRHASLSTTELYAHGDEGVGRGAINLLGDSFSAEYFAEEAV